MKSKQLLPVAVSILTGLLLIRSDAYVLNGRSWTLNEDITMYTQLGSSSGTLIDGATSWGQSAEWAMSDWNDHLDLVEFKVVRNSSLSKSSGDGRNSMLWGSTVFGKSFGSSTIAVTRSLWRGTTMSEADIVFNNSKSWNSYRGDLRTSSSGGTLQDFRRVAIHELGHLLGLDHPDDEGQFVSAIMNSRSSDLDSLSADDIRGARAIYSLDAGAPYYAQADSLYSYFSQAGYANTGLAYWFYYRAYGDQAGYYNLGYTATAQFKFYEGLGYYYYTLYKYSAPRVGAYFLYLYFANAYYDYFNLSGNYSAAASYYSTYYRLALSVL